MVTVGKKQGGPEGRRRSTITSATATRMLTRREGRRGCGLWRCRAAAHAGVPTGVAVPLRLLLRRLRRAARAAYPAGARARTSGRGRSRVSLGHGATLVGRLAVGPACDLLGPRRASGVVSLLCALALALAVVSASCPAGFVALRFVAGLSLAIFVADQHWMSRIFAPSAVGLAAWPTPSPLDGQTSAARQWRSAGRHAGRLRPRRQLVIRLGVRVAVAWRVTYLLASPLRHANHHRPRRARLPLRSPARLRRRRRRQAEELLEGGARRRQ
ncbi:hypothetical protein GUJ93_ZPchr0008g11825 [Zizania palustris]|uniref:Major facilitator superfamily (MFS) profile domain-containing protein n=1 Tax=Zizania palustris TaxID=103762 RepID=A0A8J5QWH7_ZIZPA|nr:hypothetical protein GUJ93_ZPchr0008g11825 [Zizania palustris]